MECYHHMGAHMKTLKPFFPHAKLFDRTVLNPEFSCMHLPLKGSVQGGYPFYRRRGYTVASFPDSSSRTAPSVDLSGLSEFPALQRADRILVSHPPHRPDNQQP